eukprot:scaffold126689_cov19-Tisochrysis_lutea.AAC.1
MGRSLTITRVPAPSREREEAPFCGSPGTAAGHPLPLGRKLAHARTTPTLAARRSSCGGRRARTWLRFG